MDTASRGSEDANTDDILTEWAKVFALKTHPCVMLNAQDIVRLPKYSPCEWLGLSIAKRLAVVESQLRQLNDSISRNTEKRLRMEGDLTTLTKKAATIPSQSYAETLKTVTGEQQKKLAVKLPPASTDHSRKHRMRKVESGTVKRVRWQAPRVMSESRVVDSTTQASKQSTRHLIDNVATQERSGANSIADDSDKPFEVPRYLQRKNKRRITQKMLTGPAASSDTFVAARNGNSVRELFVSRVFKEVKPDDLNNYVESKGFTVLNV